ncbi:PKD domain-containing protein [Massilia sp. LjRoot122]|uniref:PKD domain-containing protein n=1 Tax=Massilia sp. LjRoot122 TaxID=3342257 RepID=UPI003ECC9586
MQTFSIGRISTATALLALATAAAAGTSATPEAPEQHKAGSPAGKDVYGIVNLGGGDFGFIADINARGQAAFEYFGIDGLLHVGYFDGTRTIELSPPNSGADLLGDLNDKGEVAFAASLVEPAGSTPFRPFRWSASRGLVPLASLSSDGPTFISAINNRSEIVGRSALANENGAYRAVRWTATNRLIPLAAPAGIGQSFASDINDNNVTVGFGDLASGVGNVLVWDAAGRPTNLGSFGSSYAFASYTNNRGDIAGMLDTLGPAISAFLWSPGKGVARVGTRTITHGLNEIGQVVGRNYSASGDIPRAFLFSRARGLIDLHPRGLVASEANDVNDSGAVVGLGQRTLGLNIAYRWTRSGGAVDLNTRLHNPPSGLVLTSGLAISNNGDILANSNVGVVLLRPNGGTDAPVLGPIQHAQPRLNQPLDLTLSFRDRNPGDTHTATVDWGDGSGPQSVALREYRGKGEVRASHTYTSEGDFNIVVRVRDSTGKATQLFERITIRELGTPTLSGQPAGVAKARAQAASLRPETMGLLR